MNKNLVFFILMVSASFMSAEGQSRLSEILRDHVTLLASDSLSGRGFGFPEKKLAVDYITDQFEKAGFKMPGGSYIQRFKHFEGQTLVEGMNIIGIIEGSDPVLKNEYIILGAHYDHLGWKPVNEIKTVYNGADDNASGVASIIEIGRIVAGKSLNTRRSVIIAAFDGEEAGLIGSSAFAKSVSTDSIKIVAMFSLDMVGMLNKNKGVEMNGFNSVKNGEELVVAIARNQNIPVSKSREDIEMWTDTWSFGKKNIPAFFVTTGLISPYHKPEDDSNLLDYEGMGKIVLLVSEIILEMADNFPMEPDKRFINRSVNPRIMTGVTMGLGAGSFTFSDRFYRGKSVLALQAGITSKIRLTKNFLLHTALNYEMTGGNTENGRINQHSCSPHLSLVLSSRASDLSIPVFFCFAGGYYRYNFASTGRGSDYSDLYSTSDYGINFGAGKRDLKTELSLSIKYGLKDIARYNTNGRIFTRGADISYVRYF